MVQKQPNRISFEATEDIYDILDRLIEAGIYLNRSDAIRDLIRRAESMIQKGKFSTAYDLAKAEVGNNPREG